MAKIWCKEITLVAVIVILQICTAKPNTISDDNEYDVAKLFTPDELQRVKSAHIPDEDLILGRSFGLTVEEMIKLHPLRTTLNIKKNNVTFEFVGTICSQMVFDHKTATNYTIAQGMYLNESIYLLLKKFPNADHADILRTTICSYINQPDLYEMEANRFGLKFLSYLKIHYLKIKAQKVSKVERPKVIKEICCTYEGKDESDPEDTRDLSYFNSLPENELNGFNEYWIEFETENTWQSLRKICDFVEAKNPTDECRNALVEIIYKVYASRTYDQSMENE